MTDIICLQRRMADAIRALGTTFLVLTFLACGGGGGDSAETPSSFPPTMIVSVPSVAPTCPPLTGASSISTFFSSAAAATSRETIGSIVLMSIIMLPVSIPAKTPSSLR